MPEGSTSPTDEEIIATWLARVDREDREEGWAWEYVQASGLNQKWRFILGLLSAATSEAAIKVVGAGPLEELVGVAGSMAKLGNDSWIQVIETEGGKNPRLREALMVVYPDPLDPDELWQRLDAILGSAHAERHRMRELSPAEQERERQFNETRRRWLGRVQVEDYELPDASLPM